MNKPDGLSIFNDDCGKILSDGSIAPDSIDAVVTDPPYGIKFFNQKWDYEIPSVEIFKKILNVIKPGGTILCFASPHTQHRMAVNIEDAGFELRDCLMWLYGNGLPKSQSLPDLIRKSINKDQIPPKELDRIIKAFDGYRTNALKPAYEPIIMAMKPLDGNYANNAMVHKISGLNIDACRLESKGKKWKTPRGGIWKTDKNAKSILMDNTVGRFPANVIYEDNDDVKESFLKSIDPSMAVHEKNLITRIFYCAKVKGKNKDDDDNDHPTIKPLPLMKYLCRLVKSPSDCIILDPFMGSGSTGVACIQEGISFVGIEREQEYFEIAKRRLFSAKETQEAKDKIKSNFLEWAKE